MQTKHRLPRKLKKRLGKSIITLDVSAVPIGMDIEQWLSVLQISGIAVYDSGRGERPVLLKGNHAKFKTSDRS